MEMSKITISKSFGWSNVLNRFVAAGDLLDFNVHVADQKQLEPLTHDRMIISNERFNHGIPSEMEYSTFLR